MRCVSVFSCKIYKVVFIEKISKEIQNNTTCVKRIKIREISTAVCACKFRKGPWRKHLRSVKILTSLDGTRIRDTEPVGRKDFPLISSALLFLRGVLPGIN